MASPVLVTGGTGRLGKLVVARLQDSGCDVRVLARHHRPTPQGAEFFNRGPPGRPWHRTRGDRGGGHHPLRDQHEGRRRGNRNLVAAASRAGAGHLVYVSIVGIDPHRLLGISEDEAPGRRDRRQLRPALDNPASHAVLRLLPGERAKAEPVPRGASASGLHRPAGRSPRRGGEARRADAGRTRRPRTGHGRTGGEQLDRPNQGVPEGNPPSPAGVAGSDTGHPGGP